MKLFEKRPLCLILCVIIGGFSLFSSTSHQIKLTAVITAAAIFVLSLFAKIDKARAMLLRTLIAVFCISVILSHLYFEAFYPKDYYGTETEIIAEVAEADTDGNYYDEYTVITEKINASTGKYKLLVYLPKHEYNLEVGSRVTILGVISPFSSEDGFDSAAYYTAHGYSARVEEVTNVSLLESSRQGSLQHFFSNARNGVISRLQGICDVSSASLLGALLTGNRTELDPSVRLNFERCGITHILALSGMHLVIIAGALSLILSRLNKKIRLILICIFTLSYMALTGFLPSVTRAGIMLIISSLLFLLFHASDSITNLFISVFVIILASPYAVFDLSLWLSAFATLGVILYSEIIFKRKRSQSTVKRILVYLLDSLLISVFAISATLILTLYKFKAFSVIAPFTTIIFSFIITPYMYLGIIILLFGSIFPFLSTVAYHYTLFIFKCVDFFSDFKGIYASYSLPLVKPLIIALVIAFLLFTLLSVKKRACAIALITALFICVSLTAFVGTSTVRKNEDILYHSSQGSDFVLIKSEGELSVIAMTRNGRNAAYELYDYLIENDLTYIDKLIVPCCIDTNFNFVYTTLTKIYVDTLIIPTPSTDGELSCATEYADMLSDMPTRIDFIDKSSQLTVGDYTIQYLITSYSDIKTECAFLIDGENGIYAYASEGAIFSSFSKISARLNISDTVILGAFGEGKKNASFKLQKTKRILIGGNTLFDNDAIEFYNAKGVKIEYATDKSLLNTP